jgi:hypothetical protein
MCLLAVWGYSGLMLAWGIEVAMLVQRQELLRLAERIPDDSVLMAIEALRPLSEEPEFKPGDWPPAWFGAIQEANGTAAESIDRWLAEGFGAD